jgi:hypothetical protein
MTFAQDPIDWIEDAARRSERLFLRTPEGRNFSYGALREQSGRTASTPFESCDQSLGNNVTMVKVRPATVAPSSELSITT